MQMNDAWKQLAGQVVAGRFPLRQYLGSSDHSVVYLTERYELRAQKAVIKFIPASEEMAEGQLSRWRSTARLSHPNLLRLFETGRCELGGTQLLYVVMEYAEESLSQILPERPLRPHEVQNLLPPILSTLQYLHGNRFVHACLKPSNILATGDQLKMSSDGLRSIGETAHGQRAGYDAPETGHEPYSPASDVWSLGVTIVEVLTQRLPEAALHTEPVAPQTLPPPFLEIARNCLRLYPQRRWKLAEIASALSGALPKSEQEARQRVFPKWRYAVPVLALVTVLAVLFTGPKLIHRGAEAPPVTANAPQPSATPTDSLRIVTKPESKPSKPEAGKGVAPPSRRESITPEASLTPAESASVRTPEAEGAPEGVVHQVVPKVSESARNTITGKVRVWVRVTVDATGNVTDTTFDRPGPSKYFARLAQQAAQGWKFTPAGAGGQNVPREWVLRFEFGRESTQVFPSPAAGPAAKP